MKENIEEDIKILEEKLKEYHTDIFDNGFLIFYEEGIETIENLLKAYKKLQKENEELKEQNRYEWIRQHCLPQNLINKYYIPKDKIRDKIEELVNKIDGTNKGFIYACEVDLLEEIIGEISKTKQEYWNKYDD